MATLDLIVDFRVHIIRQVRSHAELRRFDRDSRVRLDALGQPYTRTDDRVVSDKRLAAKDSRTGVDHDTIFKRWMAFDVANELAIAVGREAERTERHSLI